MHSIDIDALSTMIKLSKEPTEVYERYQKEIGGVSVSTLSRVENGSLPDI